MDKPEDALRDAVSEIDLMVSDFVSRYVRELVAARVSETVSALRESVSAALPTGEPAPPASNGNGSATLSRADAAKLLSKEFRRRGNVYGDLTRLERKGLIKAHGKGRAKTIDLEEAREAMKTLPSR